MERFRRLDDTHLVQDRLVGILKMHTIELEFRYAITWPFLLADGLRMMLACHPQQQALYCCYLCRTSLTLTHAHPPANSDSN